MWRPVAPGVFRQLDVRIHAAPFFAGETQDRRGYERGDGEDKARKTIEFKSVLHLTFVVFRPEFRRQVMEDERSRARQVIDDGEYTVRRQVQKEKLGLKDCHGACLARLPLLVGLELLKFWSVKC